MRKPRRERPVWSGTVRFGLVEIPIELFRAESPRESVRFKLLDERDKSPIGTRFVSKATGRVVPPAERVRGFEVEKGEFVVVTDEEIEAARPQGPRALEVTDTVGLDEIPLIYFERPYYALPREGGERGWTVLREALRRTGKAAVGTFALHGKERVGALFPFQDVMLLEILRFAYELRDPTTLTVPQADVSPRDLELAERLVLGLSSPWRPDRYRDTTNDDLRALIDERQRHPGRVVHAPRAPERRSTKPADLAALLQQSLAERGDAETSSRPRRAASRVRAPARTKTRAASGRRRAAER